uniref:Prosaposin-like n=1 Tax=Rhizophora mucronata TaxID=61149 RepID=A0A2P2NKW7_RHIMU
MSYIVIRVDAFDNDYESDLNTADPLLHACTAMHMSLFSRNSSALASITGPY